MINIYLFFFNAFSSWKACVCVCVYSAPPAKTPKWVIKKQKKGHQIAKFRARNKKAKAKQQESCKIYVLITKYNGMLYIYVQKITEQKKEQKKLNNS